MQHAFLLARRMLARQHGTKQIVMITDGEPTAHLMEDGEVFFNYPPVRATVDATLSEVLRLTREGIRLNTFALDATGHLRDFVEKITAAQSRARVLHDPGNPRGLRARRLHRAPALDGLVGEVVLVGLRLRWRTPGAPGALARPGLGPGGLVGRARRLGRRVGDGLWEARSPADGSCELCAADGAVGRGAAEVVHRAVGSGQPVPGAPRRYRDTDDAR